jgi:hypothetical protein
MLAIVAVGSAISLGAAGMDESVLAELVRLEKETGLAIAFYENELGVISFKKRASYNMGKLVPMGSSGGTVSPDGAEVAVNSQNWGAGYRDGRFVAYVHQDFFALDVEFYHLMVRRLEDNSETRVADGVACCIGYQWVRNPELLKRAEVADKAKRTKRPA